MAVWGVGRDACCGTCGPAAQARKSVMRMVRGFVFLSGVAVVVIAGAYTLPSVERRADLRYLNPSGIHTLDPARMSWTQDLRVALNLWDGLTSYDPKTTVPVAGAARFPPDISPDRLTYTFEIRGDARWSNGDPVAAEDFIRGWRRVMEPGTGTDYVFLLTDYVAGAADYVRWRRAAVAVLAPLSRLRSGWGITGDQAKAIARDPVWHEIRAAVRTRGVREALEAALAVATAAGAERGAWRRVADCISRLDVPWARIHEDVFAAHVAELDARFARVGLEARKANPSGVAAGATDRSDTLIVHLARPCPYFLDLTAFPTLAPCHASIERMRRRSYPERYAGGAPITPEGLVVYDPQWTKPGARRGVSGFAARRLRSRDGGEAGDTNGASDVVATTYPGLITNGPYRLTAWTFKRRARLTVNPFHRLSADMTCRTVDMVVCENVSTALMAYEAGDLDFLPGIDVPYDHEIARLAASGARPDFHTCITVSTYFLSFNCVSDTVGGAGEDR
ncbi:MAG: ABC transporter substrate-binding protein [Phycisphaerae bacterium]